METVVRLTKTGSKIWEYKADTEIKKVSISHNGESIAAVTSKGRLAYFDKEGKMVWSATLEADVIDMELSSDGEMMAIATTDNKVHFYDRRGKLHWKLGLKAKVTSLSLSSTGTLIAIGALNSSAYLVDKNGKVHWTFKAGGPVRAVAISAKGTYMAVGGDDYTVHYLDSRGALRWKYTTQGRVLGLRVDANGDYVLGCSDDKRIYLFDRHGSLIWNPRNPETSRTIDMSADARTLIVGAGSEIMMFEKEGGLLRRWAGQGHSTTVAISSNGEYGVAGDSSDTIHFLSKNGELIWEFKTLGEVSSVAISSSGEHIVAGSKDNTISFFDNNTYFKNYIQEAKRKILAIKKSGINILEAEVLLQRSELELKRKEYSSAINYALGAEKVASRIKEKTKPEVSMLSVIYESLALNQPTKVNTIIMNTGSTHAKEVRLEFRGHFDIKGEQRFQDLKVNKFFETHFYLMPKQAGTVPLKIVLIFIDYENKEFMAEGMITLHVDPQVKTSLSKSHAIIQIGNIQKLAKRVQAAKTGKARGEPKPITKTGIPAKTTAVVTKCPGCGRVVQREWSGCPYCMTKLQ
jgi:WD40 repeat protein